VIFHGNQRCFAAAKTAKTPAAQAVIAHP
jgi:hypothetical protein